MKPVLHYAIVRLPYTSTLKVLHVTKEQSGKVYGRYFQGTTFYTTNRSERDVIARTDDPEKAVLLLREVEQIKRDFEEPIKHARRALIDAENRERFAIEGAIKRRAKEFNEEFRRARQNVKFRITEPVT